MPLVHEKIRFLENQLQELERQKASLQAELKKTQDELQKHPPIPSLPLSLPIANKTFSPDEKIKIFMNLFRGSEFIIFHFNIMNNDRFFKSQKTWNYKADPFARAMRSD